LLALVLALIALVLPEVPWFGFSVVEGENIRATNLLVAIWFALFSLPIFLWVRESPPRTVEGGSVLRDTARQLAQTFTEIRKHRQILLFLAARLFYNDGLVTVFAFGGIYAAGTFGFEMQEILIFGIVLNATAGAGAFLFGHLDDILGGKKTVQISLLGLSVATTIAVLAPNRAWFWIAGTMIGIFVGPTQSASRSLMGRLVPASKESEFFGFFAFSGKFTAFIGPLLLGVLTEWSGSQRVGISVVLALFVLGLLLLAFLDERKGMESAGRVMASSAPGP